jgi:hypothetical protein
MSGNEFFAEMYALYYGLQMPQRKNIAEPDRAWFDKHVGAPGPRAAAVAPAGARRARRSTVKAAGRAR